MMTCCIIPHILYLDLTTKLLIYLFIFLFFYLFIVYLLFIYFFFYYYFGYYLISFFLFFTVISMLFILFYFFIFLFFFNRTMPKVAMSSLSRLYLTTPTGKQIKSLTRLQFTMNWYPKTNILHEDNTTFY